MVSEADRWAADPSEYLLSLKTTWLMRRLSEYDAAMGTGTSENNWAGTDHGVECPGTVQVPAPSGGALLFHAHRLPCASQCGLSALTGRFVGCRLLSGRLPDLTAADRHHLMTRVTGPVTPFMHTALGNNYIC